MTYHIKIDHADGTTSRLSHVRHTTIREFQKQDRVRAFAHRDEVIDAPITRNEDEIRIRDDQNNIVFGGVIRDVIGKGAHSEIVAGDFESYMRDAEPFLGGKLYTDESDATMVHAAADRVNEISDGNIESIKSGLNLSFSHTKPAEAVRKVARATGGEIRYNDDDKTLDYVSSLGSKRDVPLSPRFNNLSVQNVDRGAADKRVTHLKGLGAGEGEAQVTATAIATDYDTSTEHKKWDTFDAPDVTDKDTLYEVARAKLDNRSTARIDMEADIVADIDINLGDEFDVLYEEENIDHTLRVVEMEKTADDNGVTYSVTLSNAPVNKKTIGQQTRDTVSESSKSTEGNAVQVSEGPGRGPVGAETGQDYVMDFYYPGEIEHEYRVELNVKGLPYRSYSKGTQHTTPTKLVDENSDRSVPSFEARDLFDFIVPSDYSGSGIWGVVVLNPQSGNDTGRIEANILDSNDNYLRYFQTVMNPSTADVAEHFLIDDRDFQPNELYTYEVINLTSSDIYFRGDIRLYEQPSMTPGIIDYDGSGNLTSLYPKNCDVVVNNSNLGTSFGDGTSEFQEQVDLKGQLNKGAWNTIRITSEKDGHIDATLSADIYRQIQGQG